MDEDEAAIRAVVQKWNEATGAGDVDTILGLMSDDAVFSVVGREPFGKQDFADMAKGSGADMSIEGTNEIVELRVLDGWAFTRNRIAIIMHVSGQEPVARSGYTLTLFRKEADGNWRLTRDANMVTPD